MASYINVETGITLIYCMSLLVMDSSIGINERYIDMLATD